MAELNPADRQHLPDGLTADVWSVLISRGVAGQYLPHVQVYAGNLADMRLERRKPRIDRTSIDVAPPEWW